MPPASSPSSSTTTVIPARPTPCHARLSGNMPQKNDASQSGSTATGKTDEENLTDSGYGSQQSTQAATVSGPEERGIELRISKSKTIRYFSGRLNEAHIEHFHTIRPSVEKLLVQHVTRKSFLRGSMPYKPMVVRPMLLGNTLLDAKPHIVVFCAPDMRKRIQGFLDTDRLIKACCEDDSRRGFSEFGITVCGCAPKLRTDDFSTDCQRNELAKQYRGKSEDSYQNLNSKDQKPDLPVTINTARRSSTRYRCMECQKCLSVTVEYPDFQVCTPNLSLPGNERISDIYCEAQTQLSDTACGTPIQFRANANGNQSKVTLGGIVKLIYQDGTWDLKALTAGHAAFSLFQDKLLDELLAELSLSSDGDNDGNSSTDEDPEPVRDLDSESILMLDPSNIFSTPSGCSKQDDPWEFESRGTSQTAILAGSILSVLKNQPMEDGRFYDWALGSLSDFMMNKLPDTEFSARNRNNRSITMVRRFTPDSVCLSSEPVILICGSSGVRRGHLVLEPARILISPGSLFVTTYMVEPLGQGLISDGDSGTWVVSEKTQDLLGHIVATDPFGAGYIVPAEDIFNDIMRSTPAVAVVLPNALDIYHKNLQVQDRIRIMEEVKEHYNDGGKSRALTTTDSGDVSSYSPDDETFECDYSREPLGRLSSSDVRPIIPQFAVEIVTESYRFQRALDIIAAAGRYNGIHFSSQYWEIYGQGRKYTFKCQDKDATRESYYSLSDLLDIWEAAARAQGHHSSNLE